MARAGRLRHRGGSGRGAGGAAGTRPSDLLFVRVGHRRREEPGPWDAVRLRAGLHPQAMEYLAERRVAVLGSDGNSDSRPTPRGSRLGMRGGPGSLIDVALSDGGTVEQGPSAARWHPRGGRPGLRSSPRSRPSEQQAKRKPRAPECPLTPQSAIFTLQTCSVGTIRASAAADFIKDAAWAGLARGHMPFP